MAEKTVRGDFELAIDAWIDSPPAGKSAVVQDLEAAMVLADRRYNPWHARAARAAADLLRTTMALTESSALYAAAVHILNRIQTDPDLYYLCGPGTETFELLCGAEAALVRQQLDVVKRERARDLQPEHRRRKARVLELQERIAELERGGSR